MRCPNCMHLIPNDRQVCPDCGSLLPLSSESKLSSYSATSNSEGPAQNKGDSKDEANGPLGFLTDQVRRVVDSDRYVEVTGRTLFSTVFKKHSAEDAEKLFIAGTSSTTPTMDELIDSWPRPWLFMRIFITGLIGFFAFFVGLIYFQNPNLLPGLIMIGSFLVPIAVLVFFWETNVPQNIALYRVAYFVFVGGILSLIMALLFYETVGGIGMNALLIGVVEEMAKVIAVIYCLTRRNYPYILNGMLVGAAVGTGFAAFESAGYALNMMLADVNALFTTLFWRALFAPGGHIVWAALMGGAICWIKGRKEWSWRMARKPRFFGTLLFVVLVHAFWDTPFAALFFPFGYFALTALSWMVAFFMIRAGMKQVSALKKQYLEERSQGQVSQSAQPNVTEQTAGQLPKYDPPPFFIDGPSDSNMMHDKA